MTEKIKIIKTEKTKDYIQKEIEELRYFKNKLLLDSDWTQLYDSGLTIKNVLKWREWRETVRDINFDAYPSDHNLRSIMEKVDLVKLLKPEILKATSKNIFYRILSRTVLFIM